MKPPMRINRSVGGLVGLALVALAACAFDEAPASAPVDSTALEAKSNEPCDNAPDRGARAATRAWST